jgi:glycerol-3-phosphate acyltransferase PlsY
MMIILWFALFLLGGYLFGSISIARIVTRVVSPQSDLNTIELPDGNEGGSFQLKTVGATTASMVLGPKYGGMIGILDILKGLIPTLAVRLLFPDQYYYLIVGLGIVIGHIWPVYFMFRGGGGLSPALGALLATAPLGLLVCVLLAFVIGIFLLKNIAFAILGGPALFILWSAIFIRDWAIILFSIFINLILFIAVIPDVAVYLKAQKEGKADLTTAMDVIPMGKMMKKMMEKMGISSD